VCCALLCMLLLSGDAPRLISVLPQASYLLNRLHPVLFCACCCCQVMHPSMVAGGGWLQAPPGIERHYAPGDITFTSPDTTRPASDFRYAQSHRCAVHLTACDAVLLHQCAWLIHNCKEPSATRCVYIVLAFVPASLPACVSVCVCVCMR
jgi:hypothetical protein